MKEFVVDVGSSGSLSSGVTSNESSFVEESYDAVLSLPVIVISTSTSSNEELSLAKFHDYHYSQDLSFYSISSPSHYKPRLVDANFNSTERSTIIRNQKTRRPSRASSGVFSCFCFSK